MVETVDLIGQPTPKGTPVPDLRAMLMLMLDNIKNQRQATQMDPSIAIGKKAMIRHAYGERENALHYALSQVDPFELVQAFHHKYGLIYSGPPRQLPADLQQFRINFLEEELDEIKLAADEGSLPDFVDGLVDLVYVAIGTLLLSMDVNRVRACFLKVQKANMTKVRCENPGDSKRESTFDVIKPPGFVPPNFDDILAVVSLATSTEGETDEEPGDGETDAPAESDEQGTSV